MYAKIRPARGNSTEWNAVDPVLLEGELAIEFPDSGIGSGLCKFKLGDGVKKWSQLAYAFDATNASSIVGGSVSTHHLISFRSGTADEWETANPVLTKGEPGFCTTNCRLKVGDGEHTWTELPYVDGRDEQTDRNYNFGYQQLDGRIYFDEDEATGDHDLGNLDDV